MRQLLLVVCFFSTLQMYSQSLLDKEVTIKFNKLNLEKSIGLLEKVSAVNFSYNSKQIQQIDKQINQDFTKTSVRKVLDFLLMNTKLVYKEIGQQVTIYELKSTNTSVVLSGYIRQKKSGEELVGARIYFPEHGIGCVANSYGFYSIQLPLGLTKFRVSSLGMLTLQDEVFIEDDMVMNIGLLEDTIMLNTVEIRADSSKIREKHSDLTQLDEIVITPNAVSRVPAAIGERDLMRHLQQFPGVQPATDGTANFQVRGTGMSGNLVMIDEIPIYHPTHLLGLYSIINTDAVKSATFHKDYIPLQYGTRSSSVLQVHTKEGDLNNYHISGGFGALMARLNVEGPVSKNKSSFHLAGRTSTFPGRILSILGNQNLGNPSFMDYNGKINVKLNSNNRIYFTGYYGKDGLRDTSYSYNWGNIAAGFRWNHVVNSKTFSNFSLVHSEFNYRYSFNGNAFQFFGQKVITDKLAVDFNNFYNNSIKINYGFSVSYLRTTKGNFVDNDAKLFLNRAAFENGFYASVEKKLSRRLIVKAGVRVPFSFHIGTGDTTAYLDKDYNLTQVIYQKNKFYDPIFWLDPRMVGTFRINEQHELQFAAMVASQTTHIINYVNYFFPIELWTPSSKYLKPERNFQVSGGWTGNWKTLKTSAVVYHKYVTNVIDYYSPIFTSSNAIESNLLSGNLRVFGLELMLTYQVKSWYSTAISYAYTNTKQRVDGINSNLPYVAPGDRPHCFSFSQYFNLTKKWQITTNYILHSGTAIHLPNGQFIVDGNAFPIYSNARNSERLPVYERFDIAFRRQLGVKKGKNHWDLKLTISNFFNEANASSAYVEKLAVIPANLIIQTVDYSPIMILLNLNFNY